MAKCLAPRMWQLLGWPAKKHLSLLQAVRRLDKRQRSLMWH